MGLHFSGHEMPRAATKLEASDAYALTLYDRFSRRDPTLTPEEIAVLAASPQYGYVVEGAEQSTDYPLPPPTQPKEQKH
jgi:hypothetical protein